MKIITNNKKGYLNKNKQISRLAVISWFSLLFGMSLYVIYNPRLKTLSLLGYLLLLLIVGPLFVLVYKQIYKERKTYFSFSSGIRGENDVKRELNKIDPSFTVFHDISIPGSKANIDFVVIGPKKLYAIEVKNHKGVVRFDGEKLLINDIPTKKNFLSQVKSEAWSLSNYILSETGKKLFVNPVLVFSNSSSKVNFGLNPVNGVQVVQCKWLNIVIIPHPIPGHEVDEDVLLAISRLKGA